VRSATEIFSQRSKIDEDSRVESVCACALHQFSIALADESTGEILPLTLLIDTSLTTSPSALPREIFSISRRRGGKYFFPLAPAIIFIWPVVNFTPALETHLAAEVGWVGGRLLARTRRRGYFAQFVRLRAKKFFVLSSTLAAPRVRERKVRCAAI
jgi:hypothetical protein